MSARVISYSWPFRFVPRKTPSEMQNSGTESFGIGRGRIGLKQFTEPRQITGARRLDDVLHCRIQVEVTLVFVPIRIAFLVGDEQARIRFGERIGQRIVPFEPLFGMCGPQQPLPGLRVAGSELGAQAGDPAFQVFEALHMVLQGRPTGKTVFAGNHQLRIAELEYTRRKPWMMLAKTRGCLWRTRTELLQKVLRLIPQLDQVGTGRELLFHDERPFVIAWCPH